MEVISEGAAPLATQVSLKGTVVSLPVRSASARSEDSCKARLEALLVADAASDDACR